MDTEKMGTLETQIGPRGSAEIHSGKRSALRAWVMAGTGRTAANILYLGTAELGAVYNDTTNAKLDALKVGAPSPAPDGEAKGETPTPMTPEDLETPKDAPEAPEAPEAPKPVKPSGNALEDRVREIAREEDVTLRAQMVKDTASVIAKLKSGTDEAKVRAIAAEEAAKVAAPERVIIVTPKPEGGEERKDMGVQHEAFERVLAIVRAGLVPALVGPAGSGKTHCASAVNEALGFGEEQFELQGACVTKSDILGFIDAGGRFQETPFSRSFKNGGVFLADEMDGWNANATLAFNPAFANGHIALPTGMTRRSKDWRPMVAMNTHGTGASRQYVGRNQMDAATLDRLVFVTFDYDEKLERHITLAEAAKVGLSDADALTWLARVQAVRHAVDALKVRHIVSPRASLGGVRLLAAKVKTRTIEDMILWKGMDAEQRARIENVAKGGR